jgi:hypothetical protein
LIDWNALNHFGELLPYFKEFTKAEYSQFRDKAFDCVASIVDKGMPESEKFQVIS